jgi:hypothetical protein
MPITDILTVQYLKDNYLFGVKLLNDDATPFPDSLFEAAIHSSISVAERELSIVLRKNMRVKRERHDVMSWQGESFYMMNVDKRPIIRVDEVAIRFAAFEASVLPNAWAHVSSERHGQVQIMPGPEGLEGFSFSGGVPILGIDVLVPREYTPRWWQLSYTAGFERTSRVLGDGVEQSYGTVDVTQNSNVVTGTGTEFTTDFSDGQYLKINGETKKIKSIVSDTKLLMDTPYCATDTGLAITHLDYDPAIMDMICIISAMLPLDAAGDLIAGAGIANFSLSMDGLSESVGTTSSATNSGYGARVIQYRDRLKKLILPAIKRSYKTIRTFVM